MARRKNEGLSFYQKEKRITGDKIHIVGGFLFLILLAIGLAYFLVYFFGIRTTVVGGSMESTLYSGQEVMIDRVIYSVLSPKEGDVVVFLPNGNENSHYYIKRVIGVPGDSIVIKDGVLYKNGTPVLDYFMGTIKDAGIASQELKLGEDEFFVMGDNCNYSEDSRSANIGAVNLSTIKGKVWFHMAANDEGLGLVR